MTQPPKPSGPPIDTIRVLALGYAREKPPSEDEIRQRLDRLSKHIRHNNIPDSRGRQVTRFRKDQTFRTSNGKILTPKDVFVFKVIMAPPDFFQHMIDLEKAVEKARELLDAGDLDTARERLGYIDRLVDDMRRQVEPGRKFSDAGRKGGKAKGATARRERAVMVAEIRREFDDAMRRNPTRSRTDVFRDIARHHDISLSTVRRRYKEATDASASEDRDDGA